MKKIIKHGLNKRLFFNRSNQKMQSLIKLKRKQKSKIMELSIKKIRNNFWI